MNRRLRHASLLGAFALGAALHACGETPVANDRLIVHAPPSSQFAAIDETCDGPPLQQLPPPPSGVGTYDVQGAGPGLLLALRCGSLDCHGSVDRNMALWGYQGMRLPLADPNATPNLPGSADTTVDELVADYHSVVGLEPEILTAVVEDGGASPERLTMVRKARGSESHKGNKIWNEGDDSDVCLTSWLASNVDKGACARAIMAIEARPCTPQ
jgi:hypothetical protein